MSVDIRVNVEGGEYVGEVMEVQTKVKAFHVFAEIGENGDLHPLLLGKEERAKVEEAIKQALGGRIRVQEKSLESVYVKHLGGSDD